MQSKFVREIALLCLPILIVGGVAWWKNSDDAPEDVWSGQARLLTRVRRLDMTPVDRYRGYTHKIAIDQWAAGQLPLVPPQRVGSIHSYRQIVPRYASLYVTFRQGKTWKRTLSISELAYSNADSSLKIPSVQPNIASLWMETIDSVGEDRGKFTSNYVLRLPTSPPVEEAFLCGQTSADMQDRDARMVGGVNTDTIVQQSELFSKPMKARLEIQDGNEETQTVNATRSVSHQPDWEVETVTVFPPGPTGANNLKIDVSLRPTSQTNSLARIRLIKPRLLDARGHEVSSCLSYGSGGGVPGTIKVNVNFQMVSKQWKILLKPLTLQTALSVDGGWPEEVNLELGQPNNVLPAKSSRQRFVREPLPLQ